MGYKNNIKYDRPSGKYHVRIESSATGRTRVYKKVCRTRRNAELWLERKEAEILGLPVESGPVLLSEAAELWQDKLRTRNRAENTIKYYRVKHTIITKEMGDMPLQNVTQLILDEYVRHRTERGIGPGTINKEIDAFKRLYAVTDVKPPWRYEGMSHSPKERRTRSPQEVRALWGYLPLEVRVVSGLCLFAGLRASEAFRVQQSWINRGDKILEVLTRKRRDTLRTALVDTLADLLPESGPVVRVDEYECDRALQKASQAVGIKPPFRGPGIFRHHCGTWGIDYSDGKFNKTHAMMVLGHQTGGVTGRYLDTQLVTQKRQFLEAVESAFLTAQPM